MKAPSMSLLVRQPAVRSGLLFLNFFLIILAYYQVKPASRSLFLEFSDASQLPYLWTASALLLVAMMPAYQWLVKRMSRVNVVLATCALIALLMVVFHTLLKRPSQVTAIGFYLLVDIFSVVLVEQFWSLTNSVYRSSEGRRWYGLIASGGLLGGLVGGITASSLISVTALKTNDLLLVAAGIITLMMGLTLLLSHFGLYREAQDRVPLIGKEADVAEGWRALRGSRYLMLIAVMLMLSQVAEPIVEYQFMHLVEQNYPDQDMRTAFLSNFLSLLSCVALAINLFITPLIHRRLGAIAGLLVQPVLLGLAAVSFAFQYSLMTAAALKITDRGLSYSINRASRELLYVPADPVTIYRAKAWIDMVGYRVFKIGGNVLILLLTQWLPWRLDDAGLSWVVAGLCLLWTGTVLMIREDYTDLRMAAALRTVIRRARTREPAGAMAGT